MCNCSGGFRNINPITRVKKSMQVAKQLWDSSKIEAKAITITKINKK
jgi:hypothetical protein